MIVMKCYTRGLCNGYIWKTGKSTNAYNFQMGSFIVEIFIE